MIDAVQELERRVERASGQQFRQERGHGLVAAWSAVHVQSGVMATLPYASRSFTTDDNPPGPFSRYRVTNLADMEIMGMYTGFSKDMSIEVLFGLKLPTGNYTAHATSGIIPKPIEIATT